MSKEFRINHCGLGDKVNVEKGDDHLMCPRRYLNIKLIKLFSVSIGVSCRNKNCKFYDNPGVPIEDCGLNKVAYLQQNQHGRYTLIDRHMRCETGHASYLETNIEPNLVLIHGASRLMCISQCKHRTIDY